MSSRNSEPETVALSVLDCCERACRHIAPDYEDAHDADAQFMKSSIEGVKSRLRVLKRQAAAGWKPEFTRMLDQVHSISLHQIDFAGKEGLRTEKLKCMACGRHEHCCKYALRALGGFDYHAFNEESVSGLQEAWKDFDKGYKALGNEYPDGTRCGRLPAVDLGDYTLGSTCLRKAELYYIVNTMIMECCFEANVACNDGYDPKDPLPGAKWYYANEENAEDFLRKLDEVELAIADDRRPVPEWGTDDVVWSNVEKSRYKAAHDDEETYTEMLRARAERVLERCERPGIAANYESEGSGEEEEEEEEEEEDGEAAHRRGRKRRRVIEDDSDEEEPICAAPERAAASAAKAGPVRKSRRQQRLSPEDDAALATGPRNEGRAERGSADEGADEGADEEADEEADEAEGREKEPAVGGSRRALPNAFVMASEQRVPGGRLPARRSALFNLGTLQLKLLREGRDADSATCTAAMFTIQELLARVDMLQHTV